MSLDSLHYNDTSAFASKKSADEYLRNIIQT